MNGIFDNLLKNEIIGYFEYESANWVKSLTNSELVANLVLFLTYRYENGDSCIDLTEIEEKKLLDLIEVNGFDYEFVFPNIHKLKEEINKYELLKEFFTIFDNKLFIKRVFDYEKVIVDKIKILANRRRILKTFFWDNSLNKLQNLAVNLSLLNNFLVISGGPGTGKTTVIKKIIESLLKEDSKHKIAISAPTGKAVSRIIESFKDTSFVDMIEPPCTIHRLLGANNRRMSFYYNEDNKLPYDIVIIDEVSMVDVELFYHLLNALKDDVRLILIGDKNQLSSVEAGAVMGELCSINDYYDVNGLNVFTKSVGELFNIDVEVLDTENTLLDCLIEFEESYRFDSNSGIALIAEAIKSVNINKLEELLNSPNRYDDLVLVDFDKSFIEKVVNNYREEIKRDFKKAIDKLKVLTPYRKGVFGSENLNFIIDKKLKELFDGKDWYNGKQVIINKNDYLNDLYNGDMGIVEVEDNKSYFLFYDLNSKEYRKIAESLVSGYELGYVLTVHKSQGSEFDDVYFVLGNKDSEMLTRELVYTAITRGKDRVVIAGSKDVLINAVKRKTNRKSVIGKLLYGSSQ
ncbi:exodeoxyribonuclease V subunit alpha [Deferribacter thermophilus]|uniref:exodeoxyribonuclease V subunit alpha n=1 Tax=Deferribacter thermophilus TaxID=53573 RepID=UPI003C1E3C33